MHQAASILETKIRLGSLFVASNYNMQNSDLTDY